MYDRNRPPRSTEQSGGGPARTAVGRSRWLAVQRAIGNSRTTRLIELQRAAGSASVQRAPSDLAELELRRTYGAPAGPKHGKPKPAETDDQGDVRLNPLWYRLEDFPPALLLDRKGALWHYVVGVDGEIHIGSEEPRGVLHEDEWTALLDGMRRTEPDLTLEQLKERLDSQGHPTIAAGFDDAGRTTVEPARVSGELQWSAANERFEVSDKSGRYMSGSVRSGVTPEKSRRWVGNVARRMARHFGVPIHPVLVKS